MTFQELGTWKPRAEKGECGTKATATHIRGGAVAKYGEFPYMVLLGYGQNSSELRYQCGGSVINKWYILTAAHCVLDVPRLAVLGELIVGQKKDCPTTVQPDDCPNSYRTRIAKVIIHEKYDSENPQSAYDIALIRVKKAMPLYDLDENNSPAVVPVCLPWQAGSPVESLELNDRLTVTGWGRISNNPRLTIASLNRWKVAQKTLQKLQVPLISNESCKNVGLYKNLIDSSIQLCAGGERGKDSCGGDSGGPLTYKVSTDTPWFQVGIISFGPNKCGIEGIPGVYTRVAPFMDWIDSKMEE